MDNMELCFSDNKNYTATEIAEILDQVVNFIDICLDPDPTKVDLSNVANRCKIDTLSMKIRKIKKEILINNQEN